MENPTSSLSTQEELEKKFHKCASCRIYVRETPGHRRKVISSKEEADSFTKILIKPIRLNDVLCSKCRSRYSLLCMKTKHEDEASGAITTSTSTSTSDSESDSQSSTVSTSQSDPTFTLGKPQEPIEDHGGCEFVELPLSRVIATHKYCFICNFDHKINLVQVPFEARLQVFIKRRLFIPHGNRCCKSHLLKKRFYDEEIQSLHIYSNESKIRVNELPKLMEQLSVMSDTKLIRKVSEFNFPEERLKTFTGLSWENVIQLRDMMTSLRNTSVRTVTQALVVFLFKLRTGNSNKITASIFEIEREQSVSEMTISIEKSFDKDIIPKLFGFQAMKRQDIIDTHTSQMVRQLYNIKRDQLVLIFDGTYIRHQKSTNNEYQRKSYSGQKKAPLCKPFTICTTNGYIVDMPGPFLGTQNDADIMKIIMENNDFRALVKKGDIFVVDRGFRDVKNLLEQEGFVVLMPALKGKRNQLTTEESNESRFVTKIRWVVEAVHGILKQKNKLLDRKLDNKLLPKVGLLCRIACFLQNQFGQRLESDKGMTEEVVKFMQERRLKTNSLSEEILQNKWSRRKVPFAELTSEDILDFPEMTEDDLKMLLTGSYQLSQAVSYLAEIMDNQGHLKVQYLKESPNIIKLQVRSRHISSKTYRCYIDYAPNNVGYDGISRYFCECANGSRTIGCCSHVAAIIYYLSYARYQSKIVRPAEILSRIFIKDKNSVVINEDSDDD